MWDRGDIVVTSATEANAVPVAEYALAQILLAGKRTLAQQARYRRERTVGPATAADPGIGNHGGVVGLIGASRIGTLVAEHLRRFDLEVLVTDPFASTEQIAELGARKVDPEELYARSEGEPARPGRALDEGHGHPRVLGLMRDGTTFSTLRGPPSWTSTHCGTRCSQATARSSTCDDPPTTTRCGRRSSQLTPHLAGSGQRLHCMGEAALGLRRLPPGAAALPWTETPGFHGLTRIRAGSRSPTCRTASWP